jgi:hypothetical protein
MQQWPELEARKRQLWETAEGVRLESAETRVQTERLRRQVQRNRATWRRTVAMSKRQAKQLSEVASVE